MRDEFSVAASAGRHIEFLSGIKPRVGKYKTYSSRSGGVALIDWLKAHETLIVSISGVSVVVFVATMIVIPLLIVRMPADYFVREKIPLWFRLRPEWRMLLFAAKNLLGGILLLGGLAMLVLPGQGALTILVGIMLLDFPGKLRLERWLIRRRAIHRTINWIRAKRHRPPLQLPSA